MLSKVRFGIKSLNCIIFRKVENTKRISKKKRALLKKSSLYLIVKTMTPKEEPISEARSVKRDWKFCKINSKESLRLRVTRY